MSQWVLELQICLSASILCKWQKYEHKNLHTLAMAPFAKYSAVVTRHLHVFHCCRVLLTSWSHTVILICQEYYNDNIPIQTELHSTFLLFYNILLNIWQQYIVYMSELESPAWGKRMSPCIKTNMLYDVNNS